MQVLCTNSENAVEARCSICGQGFALYWEHHTRSERAEALRQIERTLRSHHIEGTGREAHPARGFMVPEWVGPMDFAVSAPVEAFAGNASA